MEFSPSLPPSLLPPSLSLPLAPLLSVLASTKVSVEGRKHLGLGCSDTLWSWSPQKCYTKWKAGRPVCAEGTVTASTARRTPARAKGPQGLTLHPEVVPTPVSFSTLPAGFSSDAGKDPVPWLLSLLPSGQRRPTIPSSHERHRNAACFPTSTRCFSFSRLECARRR